MRSRRAVSSAVLATVLTLSACSSGSDSDAGSARDDESPGVVADLLQLAHGEESAAIVGTLLAVDRGFTLDQVADAAAGNTLDLESGAIDGAEPVGDPQNVYTDDTRAGARDGAAVVPAVAVRARVIADRDEVDFAARAFLETEPSILLSGLGSNVVGLPAPVVEPDADPAPAAEGTHLALILVLLGSGYSPEQIVSALILGDLPKCAEGRCTLDGEPPLLPGQPNFLDVLLGVEANPEASVAGEWTGELLYTDDTITLEIGTNTVTITRDADGVFTIKALLTYRTIPDTGTCDFSWTKEFDGTGELDASGAGIDFAGVESVVSTSSCPDANTIDNVAEVVRRVSVVDGDTLEGVVATGEFSISGPQIG